MAPKQSEWLGRDVRVTVTSGPYQGRTGKAIRPDGRGTWVVHLDGRFGGTSVPTQWLAPE